MSIYVYFIPVMLEKRISSTLREDEISNNILEIIISLLKLILIKIRIKLDNPYLKILKRKYLLESS